MTRREYWTYIYPFVSNSDILRQLRFSGCVFHCTPSHRLQVHTAMSSRKDGHTRVDGGRIVHLHTSVSVDKKSCLQRTHPKVHIQTADLRQLLFLQVEAVALQIRDKSVYGIALGYHSYPALSGPSQEDLRRSCIIAINPCHSYKCRRATYSCHEPTLWR